MHNRKPSAYPGYVNKAKKLYIQCTDERRIAQDGNAPLIKVLEDFGGLPMLEQRPCSSNPKCVNFKYL